MGLKEAFRETGKGFWFKNGRFFGVQRGSLDQRLTDPYYGDVKVIEYYWKPWGSKFTDIYGSDIMYGPEEGVAKIIATLSFRVNQGTADVGLIPHINQRVDRTITPVMESDFLKKLNDPRTLLHAYREILEQATTIESISYLLEAIKSQLRIKRDKPFKVDSERFTGGYFISESGPTISGRQTYAIYETTDHHEVSFPFGELAKLRSVAILADVKDKQLKYEIMRAVAEFDQRGPKVIQEEHKRYELIEGGGFPGYRFSNNS